ncbi:hypothetical protein FF950_14900, partial [Pseudoxanthomonas sp. X-1]
MSDASNPARARTRPWNDRVDPWVGALLSLLLHLLMLWVLLHADVPVVQTTQGAPNQASACAGSRASSCARVGWPRSS